MKDIVQVLQDQFSGSTIEILAKRIGTQSLQNTALAVNGIVALLVNALSINVSTNEGAESLHQALLKSHDGSILESTKDILDGEESNPLNSLGILSYILGGNISLVIKLVSKWSGVDKKKVGVLMLVITPIVMGAIGKIRRQYDINSPKDLVELLQKGASKINDLSIEGTAENTSIFNKVFEQSNDDSWMKELLTVGAKYMLKGLFAKV